MLAWTAQSLPSLLALCAALAALYLAPGYAVLGALWPRDRFGLNAAERFGAALGIGVALPPLLIYLSSFVGLKWSPAAVWVYVAVAAAALVIPAAARRARGSDERRWRIAWQPSWAALLLVALTLLALVTRLYTVRDFRAGLFGDSVHHTMIAQLLLDNGGLFTSYQPYAPLSTFTYHFGFHANVAFFAWLTATPATLGTLIVGQVLNAASVPLAFLLTSRVIGLGGRPSMLPIAAVAGLWTAALTGFVNLMPAFYVNWGRYTQLTGQLVLPVAVVAFATLLERAREAALRQQGPLLALSALLTACLMLTHYTVTVFAAVMVGAYLLALIARDGSARAALRLILPAAIAAGAALLLALPWVANTLTGGLARNTNLLIAADDAQRVASYAALTPITPTFLKTWMLALAAAGLTLALARREWRPALFAAWSALLVLIVTPHTVGLPGTGVVDQFAVYIALYLTVLPLVGYALAATQEWAAEHAARWAGRGGSAGAALARLAQPAVQRALAAAAVAAVCLWGTTWLRGVGDAAQQMLTAADERAMAWIRENTPADARILVNAFPAYGGSLVAGTDGGWWIPLLAGRQTNLPPLTYGSEQWERNTFYIETNQLPEALRGRPLRDGTPVRIDLTTPEALARLRAAGLSYVYSGANPTPGPDRADRFDTDALRVSDAFRLVFDRDGVQIFQLVE